MATRMLVIATLPEQYQPPFFRALAAHEGVDLGVLYTFLPTTAEQGADSGADFVWDAPLLDGYRWREVPAARGLGRSIAAEKADVLLILAWHSSLLVRAALASRHLRLQAVVWGGSHHLPCLPFHVGANKMMAPGQPGFVPSRVDCREHLIEERVTGVVIRLVDVEALAEMLVALAPDPRLTATTGPRAGERALAGVSVESGVAGTLSAFRFLDRGAKESPCPDS